MLKKIINKIIGVTGYKLYNEKYISSLDSTNRLIKLLQQRQINIILDIGANTGEFGELFYRRGFKGKIISFEPLKNEFEILKRKASKFNNWSTYDYALGDKNEETEINISANSVSSSLLQLNERHLNAASNSVVIKSQSIIVKRLDSVFESLIKADDREAKYFLKIDTQGFEEKVIEGGLNTLKMVDGILVETSFVELYKDQALFDSTYKNLYEKGFRLFGIDGIFYDTSGQLLQADCIFFKE